MDDSALRGDPTPGTEAGIVLAPGNLGQMLPRNYAIPRSGNIVGVTASTPGDLRAVRSELELLRRVGECARRRELASGSVRSPRFSDEDRRELATILRDAAHPLVACMIEQIDTAFPEIREDLPMPAVKKEAEQLAREMEESGVLDDVLPGADPATVTPAADAPPARGDCPKSAEAGHDESAPFGDETTLMSTLDRAAADMAALVGEYSTGQPTATKQQNEATPDAPVPSSTPSNKAPDESFPEGVSAPKATALQPSAMSIPFTASEAGVASTTILEQVPSVSTDAADAAFEPATVTGDVPSMEQAAAPAVAEVPARAPAAPVEPVAGDPKTSPTNDGFIDKVPNVKIVAPMTCDAPAGWPAPERLRGAVDEVESGVQRIARLISEEVRQQSIQVMELATDLAKRREEFNRTLAEAEAIVRELRALREQSLADRADVEACRRETGLLREAARSAKLRADRAADSAESAAEQSMLDAAAARSCTTTAP